MKNLTITFLTIYGVMSWVIPIITEVKPWEKIAFIIMGIFCIICAALIAIKDNDKDNKGGKRNE